MPKKIRYDYILTLQYHGENYFGWQKQKNLPTVQGKLEEALEEVYLTQDFYTMGSGRTDAKVSALDQKVKISIPQKIQDQRRFLREINTVLPLDIRVTNCEESFNKTRIINMAKEKEYLYFFSNNQESSALQASLFPNFSDPLDLKLMNQACELFIGSHNFSHYQWKAAENKIPERTIYQCQLKKDTKFFTGEMLPQAYCFQVVGNGFLKQMVRIMMGTLIRLGRGETSLEEIRSSLTGEGQKIGFIAPAQGLYMYRSLLS